MTDKSFDLRGKDYFTREEAAHYACWSERHWDKMRGLYGIQPIQWGGKTVYRRDDIQRAIEGEACRQSANAAIPGISTGTGRTGNRRGSSRSTQRHSESSASP